MSRMTAWIIGEPRRMKDFVMKNRNEHAAALYHRAGNAGAAVAVDTRPKSVPGKKRRNDRKATRQKLRAGRFD